MKKAALIHKLRACFDPIAGSHASKHALEPILSATRLDRYPSEIHMRADVEAAKADIEQSIELLRRRL